MSEKNPITKIDFPLLHKQKERLVKLVLGENNQEDREALDGILNLIDSIQDYAVDVLGMDEGAVFPRENILKDVSFHLHAIWVKIGIDRPSNHDEIVLFCADDIEETADPDDWHSGDVEIAFRRWIERWELGGN